MKGTYLVETNPKKNNKCILRVFNILHLITDLSLIKNTNIQTGL